jgi:hypothetical protein
MTRYLVAALLLIVVLFGTGYYVRGWLWPDDRGPTTALATTAATAPDPGPQPMAPLPVIEVTSLTGRVEVRESPTSEWRTVSANAKLGPDDALRTDESSSAVLSIGSAVHVELAEHSEFALAQITQEVSRLRLESGRVAARLDGKAAQRLRLEVRGSEAVTEASDGAFSVMRADNGQVTVAATAGKVSVQAKDRKIELPAGQQSIVPVNGVPSPPTYIPNSLLLKVAQSARSAMNRRETAVSGKTSPGAIVSVNGVPAVTNEIGEFTTQIPLQEGANRVTVTAVDALGRVEQRQVAVEVDTQAPKLGSKVVW